MVVTTVGRLLQAERVFTKAMCWRCGKDLAKVDTMLVNPKTGRSFCSPGCKEVLEYELAQAKKITHSNLH